MAKTDQVLVLEPSNELRFKGERKSDVVNVSKTRFTVHILPTSVKQIMVGKIKTCNL